MNKGSISVILLSFSLMLSSLYVNANALYTVDENGNWIPTMQTTSTQMPTYNQSTPSNNQVYNTNIQNNMPDIVTQIEKNTKAENIPIAKNQSTAEMENLINKIGANLIKSSNIRRKVNFKLDNSSERNAFTSYDGNIRILRGLIESCENEDELAAVMAHELGHATSYHGYKSMAVGTAQNYASPILKNKLLGKINAPVGGKVLRFMYDKTEQAGRSFYERGQEKDADLLAVDYTVAAGYNPLGHISILNKISSNYLDFWENHPSKDYRVLYVYKYIQEKYPQYIQKGFETDAYKQAYAQYVRNKI